MKGNRYPNVGVYWRDKWEWNCRRRIENDENRS